jgi:hypothetical protein
VKKPAPENQLLIMDRVAEGGREAALLWFVFSALDALITSRLTIPWAAANTVGAFGVWILAIYVEIWTKEHDESDVLRHARIPGFHDAVLSDCGVDHSRLESRRVAQTRRGLHDLTTGIPLALE